jgi:hypothetical protein
MQQSQFCFVGQNQNFLFGELHDGTSRNFDRGAARSGIRQIGNVIIFHLWSSFMESHSWLKVIKRHFVGCF